MGALKFLIDHYKKHGIEAIVKQRDPDIQELYIVSDHIICRAGASTLYELAAMGKAPLLIPFPGAKDQHQLENARTIVEQQSGWLIEEKDLTSALLLKQLKSWLEIPDDDYNKNIKKFARPEAAKHMQQLLFQL